MLARYYIIAAITRQQWSLEVLLNLLNLIADNEPRLPGRSRRHVRSSPKGRVVTSVKSRFLPFWVRLSGIDNFFYSEEHRAHKGLNERIENSHRPTRKREKIFGRFKSPRHAQRILSAHDQIKTIFRPHRNKLSAVSYRRARSDAFSLWRDYTGEMNA